MPMTGTILGSISGSRLTPSSVFLKKPFPNGRNSFRCSQQLFVVVKGKISHRRKLCPGRAAALSADQPIAGAACNVVLHQPHSHADADQDRRQACGTAKVDGRCSGIAVNIGCEDTKTNAPAWRVGRAVFRERSIESPKHSSFLRFYVHNWV